MRDCQERNHDNNRNDDGDSNNAYDDNDNNSASQLAVYNNNNNKLVLCNSINHIVLQQTRQGGCHLFCVDRKRNTKQ